MYSYSIDVEADYLGRYLSSRLVVHLSRDRVSLHVIRHRLLFSLYVDQEISNYPVQTEKSSQGPGVHATHEEETIQANEMANLSQESDTDPSLAEQTPKVEDESISPQKLDAVGVTTTNGGQITQVHDETKLTERFEFELHYGLSSRTFGSVLCDILSDMATYKHIYNWNEKLFASPLKAILKVVHRS